MVKTDAISLQEKIIGDKESIREIIEALGYVKIKEHSNYFSFPRLDGDNQSANVIYIDTLKWACYTRRETGNLFTLVMTTKNYNFPESLKFCAKTLGITNTDVKKKKYPFSGFYKTLMKSSSSYYKDVVYPESILKDYSGVSQKFFKDGVSLKIQEKFGVSFSHKDNAIAIPIRNINGELIGVKMRNNDSDCPHDKRFWAAYKYPKNRVVYGLWNNYLNIVKKNTAIIFESEKAVMQAASCGCNVALGIGGHDISLYQLKLIKSLMVDKIIIAFDEGLDEYEILEQCEKLKSSTSLYHPKIYYIYDKDNIVLKRGSKDSPIDHGKIIFQKLLKNYTYEYEVNVYES